jgi:hypothetical protein
VAHGIDLEFIPLYHKTNKQTNEQRKKPQLLFGVGTTGNGEGEWRGRRRVNMVNVLDTLG